MKGGSYLCYTHTMTLEVLKGPQAIIPGFVADHNAAELITLPLTALVRHDLHFNAAGNGIVKTCRDSRCTYGNIP